MANKQHQSAADGAVAVQAGGNVTVNQGISPEQMIQIMDAVAKQIQMFSVEAKSLVDERLTNFKESILQEFAEKADARSEAFSDPDFQHSLFSAQTAYARTGDDDLHSVLLDLVVQRSKQEKRDRLALTLNDAIDRASSLTDEDFSILAMAFWSKQVLKVGPINVAAVASVIKDSIDLFLEKIPEENLAYTYLESHGCLRLGEFLQQPSFISNIKTRYPNVFTKGLHKEEIEALIPKKILDANLQFMSPSEFDQDRFVFTLGDKVILESLTKIIGLEDDFIDNYIEKVKKNAASDEEATNKLRQYYKRIDLVAQKYDKTPIRNCQLTTVGIALAHAHLTKTANFQGDLSIWIK